MFGREPLHHSLELGDDLGGSGDRQLQQVGDVDRDPPALVRWR
jgi:hypothetical protein